MSESNPQSQRPADIEGVLARLSALLKTANVSGFDVDAALDAITGFRERANPMTLDTSSLRLELEAVVERLAALVRASPSDHWEIDETLAQVTEVLRVMTDEAVRRRLLAEPDTALRLILEALAGVSDGQIEKILGAKEGEISVWVRTGVPARKTRRVGMAAQVILALQRSMSANGITRWFHAERAQLDGRTPAEVLDSDAETDMRTLRSLAQAPHQVLTA